MVKRCFAVILLLLLIPVCVVSEPAWREETQGQSMLHAYIEAVNACLLSQGEQTVNSIFEMYPRQAVLGITSQPGAETPEDVEITVSLTDDSISLLQLRVSSLSRFPPIAAAFLQALDTEGLSADEARKVPAEKTRKALDAPADSFEEDIEILNGDSPRTYYAYYPNQHHDGISWLQLTIVFPLSGAWNGGRIVEGVLPTKGPDTYSGNDAEYEGYFSEDDFSHLDVFVTETPEPDSAASEYDPFAPH